VNVLETYRGVGVVPKHERVGGEGMAFIGVEDVTRLLGTGETGAKHPKAYHGEAWVTVKIARN